MPDLPDERTKVELPFIAQPMEKAHLHFVGFQFAIGLEIEQMTLDH